MELRSKRRLNTTLTAKSINDILPNEIVEIIIQFLPTQDLLHSRLVCKLWKFYASALCRNRYVSINLLGTFFDAQKVDDLYSTFKDHVNLPWSACALEVTKETRHRVGCLCCNGKGVLYSIDSNQLTTFMRQFGNAIRKITISGEHIQGIISAFMEMPNLEVINPRFDPIVKNMKSFKSANIKFWNLKHIKISICSTAGARLVDFFWKASDQKLVSIRIKLLGKNHGSRFLSPKPIIPKSLVASELATVVGLLQKIPKVSLDISDSWTGIMLETFISKGLKPYGLRIYLKHTDDAALLRSLEQFLSSISDSLEDLRLCDNSNSTEENTRHMVKIPTMTKLNELQYTCGSRSPKTTLIHPFTTNQFPNLQTVRIETMTDDDEDGEPEVLTALSSASFDSVTEFVLDNSVHKNKNPMQSGWGKVFPNLIKLTILGVTMQSHLPIYKSMTKVEHLHLMVSEKEVEESDDTVYFPGDAATITCGYPKETKSRTRKMEPSLRCLTALKTLFLDFTKCDEEVDPDYPPSTIHLALLKISTLDCLTFQNIKISEEVLQQLRSHHRRVEVLFPKPVFEL